MDHRDHQSLVVPSQANKAVLRPGGESVLIETAPRWLTSSLGHSHSFPEEVQAGLAAGHPLGFLISTALDIVRNRLPLHDFLAERESENGDLLAILMQGRLEEDPDERPQRGPAVVLDLREVTEIVRARRQAAAIGAFHGLVGQSLPMFTLFHKIATYGPTEAPVLITGETGTGKELVARALHDRSRRSDGPFVAVNCSALTPELFESELFGHEKGSFTGAHRQHRGRFQRADGGSLFLDEIGDMPLMTQSKMLRALEEGIVERVGGEREERVDVRIIAATNITLEQAVQTRQFRADLYHRLSVLRVHVPALRERKGDLPLLIDHYLDLFNRRHEKNVRRVTPEALKIMEAYHWPGNVRELRNVLERLVIEAQGEAIGGNALAHWMEEREYLMPGSWNADAYFAPREPIYAGGVPPSSRSDWHPEHAPRETGPMQGARFWGDPPRRNRLQLPMPSSVIEAAPISLSEEEKASASESPPEAVELTPETIRGAYRQSKGNLTRAASRLGIHKATLYRHMKRLGLSRENLEKDDESGT